ARPPGLPLVPYTALFRSWSAAWPASPSTRPARCCDRRCPPAPGPSEVRWRVVGHLVVLGQLVVDGDRRLDVEQAGLLERGRQVRSEEHTSELQSRENLVC